MFVSLAGFLITIVVVAQCSTYFRAGKTLLPMKSGKIYLLSSMAVALFACATATALTVFVVNAIGELKKSVNEDAESGYHTGGAAIAW